MEAETLQALDEANVKLAAADDQSIGVSPSASSKQSVGVSPPASLKYSAGSKTRKVYIVGGSAPSGVGKSTLCTSLCQQFCTPLQPIECGVLKCRQRDVPKLQGEFETALNDTTFWAHPDTIDLEGSLRS